MSTFVKKVAGTEYYKIDELRAAGLIPYYLNKGDVYIMINTEIKGKSMQNNIIGGKVDKYDNTISDTMIREFNEETGFLVFDKINKLKCDIMKETILLEKPKYKFSLLKVSYDSDWENLPILYEKMYKNEEKVLDRESVEIKWVNLFNFKETNCTYLLSFALSKLKNYFRKYDKDNDNLFVD
tara:strand:+ start:147 stop:692 length:546 start_codon:yes stop_codon:yes gene_type:complete